MSKPTSSKIKTLEAQVKSLQASLDSKELFLVSVDIGVFINQFDSQMHMQSCLHTATSGREGGSLGEAN